jgi:hypothetical protein
VCPVGDLTRFSKFAPALQAPRGEGGSGKGEEMLTSLVESLVGSLSGRWIATRFGTIPEYRGLGAELNLADDHELSRLLNYRIWVTDSDAR